MNEQTVSQFMAEYLSGDLIARTSWKGTYIFKAPTDLWVFGEIVHEIRPERIIECGTGDGGSALWLADLLDTNRSGEVLSIDALLHADLPSHPRLTYYQGNSVGEPTLERVGEFLDGRKACLVILDSDHHAEHVERELDAYAPLVGDGGYLIVEDTHIGRPLAIPGIQEGPADALDRWLPKHPEFAVDLYRERFGLTVCKGGFLRRTSCSP